MKIIGKAKGKAPKAWCLMKDVNTGHYHVGWDGYWPIHGSYTSILDQVAAIKAEAKPEPHVGAEVQWPGFHVQCRSIHQPKLTQEQLDEYAAYENYRKEVYAHSEWEKDQLKLAVEPLDYVPVFQDGLRFIGYTRGRSSVTMKFEASNGQEIEFGPSGIDGLIKGIIDGTCVPVELEGTYEDEGEWDRDKQEYVNRQTLPRGKGILATFKFAKKGANTYAELTEV